MLYLNSALSLTTLGAQFTFILTILIANIYRSADASNKRREGSFFSVKEHFRNYVSHSKMTFYFNAILTLEVIDVFTPAIIEGAHIARPMHECFTFCRKIGAETTYFRPR